MIRVFAVADTHFFHENILEYEKRPFESVEEMNETIVANWNKTVGKYDKVYLLGDVAISTKENIRKIMSRLSGVKILVKGNHDKKSNSFWIEAGFFEVSSNPIVLGRCILSHAPLTVELSIGDFLNIHGHVHSKTEDYEGKYPEKYKCVSVEKVNYTPLEIGDMIKR